MRGGHDGSGDDENDGSQEKGVLFEIYQKYQEGHETVQGAAPEVREFALCAMSVPRIPFIMSQNV